ncbi:MAG: PHP domain-containing protein [Fibrobacterota bacterium]
MIAVDLHTHSSYSLCGMHTYIELVNAAKKAGLAGLAITDHGPAQKGVFPPTFLSRLHTLDPEIILYKGVEANILSPDGDIDITENDSMKFDIILAGFHDIIPDGQSQKTYTDMLIRLMKNTPAVDIISHPNLPEYPICTDTAAEAAAHYGVALELNNSKLVSGKMPEKNMTALLRSVKKFNCPVVINSDAHTAAEVGKTGPMEKRTEKEGIPLRCILNAHTETCKDFIAQRRNKKATAGDR